MPTAVQHQRSAAAAKAAAESLRVPHPGWALVPLFYSAMHLMHAKFDLDQLPDDMRHPSRHNSHREDGVIAKWGTTDVVRQEYPSPVSRAYSSLLAAGHAARYNPEPIRGDGARLWSDYAVIEGFAL